MLRSQTSRANGMSLSKVKDWRSSRQTEEGEAGEETEEEEEEEEDITAIRQVESHQRILPQYLAWPNNREKCCADASREDASRRLFLHSLKLKLEALPPVLRSLR